MNTLLKFILICNLLIIFSSLINACQNLDNTPVLPDCRRYYKCQRNALVTKQCPPGTLFDLKMSLCNHPYLVDCPTTTVSTTTPLTTTNTLPTTTTTTTTTTSTTTSTSTTTTTTVQRCLWNDEWTPIYNCYGYVRCPNFIRTEFMCPFGTLFDVNINQCNHAYKVECSMTTTPTTVTPTTSSTTTLPTTSKTTITTTISTLLIQRCRLSSDLTPINNCMGYIRCINGIRIELECPSGTLFDSQTKFCNLENLVIC